MAVHPVSKPFRKASSEAEDAGINVSNIRVGGGIVGFVFSAGVVAIFLAGIPSLRWFPVGALAAGATVALALRAWHRHRPTHIDDVMRGN